MQFGTVRSRPWTAVPRKRQELSFGTAEIGPQKRPTDCDIGEVYIQFAMQFAWDGKKRLANIKAHGFDFFDAPRVFEGPTFTFEDDRFGYGEQRLVTLGFLGGITVSIVQTETSTRIRVISFRRATRNEQTILFENLKD